MRFVITTIAILIRAWVAVLLWQWFVVPTFHLVPLTYPAAIGLSMLTRVMLPTPPLPDPDKETIADVFIVPIARPLVLLGIGYIAAQCMF